MGMESVFYGFEILKLNRMEAREYLKLATDKTEAGDLIKENNLTEAIIKMLENYALIRVKNCSIPDVERQWRLYNVSQRYTIEDIERCVENWGLCKVEKEYIEKFLNGG